MRRLNSGKERVGRGPGSGSTSIEGLLCLGAPLAKWRRGGQFPYSSDQHSTLFAFIAKNLIGG